jgi:hypothetical protein
MKRIIAITIVIIILSESILPKTIGFMQSFKIVSLIEHYQVHLKETSKQIAFNEFLWMHYNPSSKHDNPKHSHEKLPNFDSQNSFHIIQIIIESITLPKVNYLGLMDTNFIEFKSSYIYLFSLDLFNPPRI